jgi:mannose-6-phosphate isomerase-like protein (cupin superfamily)
MSAPQSVVLAPDEGEVFLAGPFTIRTRVSGAQTAGTFELYELQLGPATVDYHVHDRLDETIFVLEGTIEFRVGSGRFTRAAGSVAFVPRGVHHGFTNPGPGQARVLIQFSPSGRQDEYFRRLVPLFAAPVLDVAALQALQQQYDQVLISAPA